MSYTSSGVVDARTTADRAIDRDLMFDLEKQGLGQCAVDTYAYARNAKYGVNWRCRRKQGCWRLKANCIVQIHLAEEPP
ncbi:hypothetical protein L596_012971 [Steinernema carpocapsae]|uniref:Uncharacterized protein n=1 Tax=Steinernema carpocapsae TaxID=34508 RepID=A0A4U5NZ01_STECR|nr:hypothetical protein L596_012971 [Steinernema carpocapsae]